VSSTSVSRPKLDNIDRRLLEILQNDAKTPYSKIAEALKVSEATVHLRIKKLLKQGVIRRFQAIVDPEKVGKNTVAIIAITITPSDFENALEELKNIPEVYELYDVTGEYYAIAKVRVSSKEQLTKVLDKIGKIKGVESTKTMYVLRTLKEELRIAID